jgi:hypothetical protein
VTTTCRSCGAEIVFARTREGRLMPVDAHPHPAGTVTLEWDPASGEWRAILGGQPSPGTPMHRPHFATCPAAAEWRRPRRTPAR